MKYKKYLAYTRCAMSRRIAYKGSILIGSLSNTVSMAAKLFLWFFLFKEQPFIAGYTWQTMSCYLLVAFFCDSLLSYSTELDLSNKIIDGSVSLDLVKPVHMQNMCFFEALGASLTEMLIILPMTAILFLIFGCFCVITTYAQPLFFLLSLPLAFMVRFMLVYIAGLMCFYTSNGFGVIYMRQVITNVFSGSLIPVVFFPEWLRNMTVMLPFQASVYLPAQLFLGHLQGTEAWKALALQMFWAIALWLTAKFLFMLAVRKVTIHGG